MGNDLPRCSPPSGAGTVGCTSDPQSVPKWPAQAHPSLTHNLSGYKEECFNYMCGTNVCWKSIRFSKCIAVSVSANPMCLFLL